MVEILTRSAPGPAPRNRPSPGIGHSRCRLSATRRPRRCKGGQGGSRQALPRSDHGRRIRVRLQGLVYPHTIHAGPLHRRPAPAQAALAGASIRSASRLVTSRRMETAWLEAQQGFIFKAQPLTLCAYRVDCIDSLILRIRGPFRASHRGSGTRLPWEILPADTLRHRAGTSPAV